LDAKIIVSKSVKRRFDFNGFVQAFIVEHPIPKIFLVTASNCPKQICQMKTGVSILVVCIFFPEQQDQCLKNPRLAGIVLAGDEIDPLERFNLQIPETPKVFYVQAF